MGDRPAYATISRVGGPWPTFSPALRSALRLKPGGHVRMLDGICDSTKLTSTVAAGPIGSSQTDGSVPRSRCGPTASGSAWLRVTCRHRSTTHRVHRCAPPPPPPPTALALPSACPDLSRPTRCPPLARAPTAPARPAFLRAHANRGSHLEQLVLVGGIRVLAHARGAGWRRRQRRDVRQPLRATPARAARQPPAPTGLRTARHGGRGRDRRVARAPGSSRTGPGTGPAPAPAAEAAWARPRPRPRARRGPRCTQARRGPRSWRRPPRPRPCRPPASGSGLAPLPSPAPVRGARLLPAAHPFSPLARSCW